MELTPLVQKAIYISAQLHFGQKRKANNLPYIVHPYSVALILAQHTKDEKVIAAALLHDILEDVDDYTEEDMRRDFGETVTEIVVGVSGDQDMGSVEVDDKISWQARKENYLATLKQSNQESLMVSCADKIHNLSSMMMSYEEQGEKMWDKFNAPADRSIWFYGEVLQILKRKLNSPIVYELEKVYAKAQETFM